MVCGDTPGSFMMCYLCYYYVSQLCLWWLKYTAPHCTHVLATPQMTRQDTWHQETNFQEVKSIKIIMKIWPLIDSKILQFSKLQPLNMGKSQAESGLQRSSLHNAGLIRFCCGLGERATEPTPALSNDQNLRNASDEGSMSRGSFWHPELWRCQQQTFFIFRKDIYYQWKEVSKVRISTRISGH